MEVLQIVFNYTEKRNPYTILARSSTWHTYLKLTASCWLEQFSFVIWSEGFVKWRNFQKHRFSTVLMTIVTIRNICLQLTWMHSMLKAEIQAPLNRNKVSCTCWQHASIIQLFTKTLFTFLKLLIKHEHLFFLFFLDEIDLWNYLLFVMSCLFVEQMCICYFRVVHFQDCSVD